MKFTFSSIFIFLTFSTVSSQDLVEPDVIPGCGYSVVNSCIQKYQSDTAEAGGDLAKVCKLMVDYLSCLEGTLDNCEQDMTKYSTYLKSTLENAKVMMKGYGCNGSTSKFRHWSPLLLLLGIVIWGLHMD